MGKIQTYLSHCNILLDLHRLLLFRSLHLHSDLGGLEMNIVVCCTSELVTRIVLQRDYIGYSHSKSKN